MAVIVGHTKMQRFALRDCIDQIMGHLHPDIPVGIASVRGDLNGEVIWQSLRQCSSIDLELDDAVAIPSSFVDVAVVVINFRFIAGEQKNKEQEQRKIAGVIPDFLPPYRKGADCVCFYCQMVDRGVSCEVSFSY